MNLHFDNKRMSDKFSFISLRISTKLINSLKLETFYSMKDTMFIKLM